MQPRRRENLSLKKHSNGRRQKMQSSREFVEIISLSNINSLVETYLRNLRSIFPSENAEVKLDTGPGGVYYDSKLCSWMQKVNIKAIKDETEVKQFIL
jgi:hypothetical protein